MLRRRPEIVEYRACVASASFSSFSPPFLPANFFNPFFDKENARGETEADSRSRAFHFYYRGAR